MTNTILAETLSGDWVVTRTHSDEPSAETELARFNASATTPRTFGYWTMLRLAAQAAVSLDIERDGIAVQSPSRKNRKQMEQFVRDSAGTVFHFTRELA